QSRVRDYRPQMLDELLYEDRRLLDGWDKMASIYRVEDWPYFSRRRVLMQEYYAEHREIVDQVAPALLQEIAKNGARCSLDFKGFKKTKWAWGPTSASRAGLEGLYKIGRLGVDHRVGSRRYFDLIERLLPKKLLGTPDPNPMDDDYQDWHILRRMGNLGLAHPQTGEHWMGIQGVKTKERREILARLLAGGEIREVRITELPDQIFYLRTTDLPTLEFVQAKQGEAAQAAIIAPLDNLIWDRKLLGTLFDFSYIWEVYKPKAKRQYGYYVLPVIYGDRFVARFDPAFDKKTRYLTIQNWWWEKDVIPDQDMEQALARCLGDFAVYLDAQEVSIGEEIEDMGWLFSSVSRD
ncbi:MAG: crosslink repair DNA glycosylase YcaQ family protein, partial [Chloroflexota bacterium]